MKKLYILAALFPLNALAENISLDNLFLLNNKNYCLQVSQGQYKNIYESFNLKESSVPVIAGVTAQGIAIGYPTVSIINSGQDLALDLIKSNPQIYSEKSIAANPIKDTYSITNTIDLRFNESPGELLNKLSNTYKGLVFKQEALGGGYLFKQEKPIDLSKVRNITEFNKEYDRYIAAAFTFSISSLKGEFKGGSSLSYSCTVNLVTTVPIQDIATSLKAKVVPNPNAVR